MALFARICVLCGFPAAAYRSRFAGTKNPCAALIRTKLRIYDLETQCVHLTIVDGH